MAGSAIMMINCSLLLASGSLRRWKRSSILDSPSLAVAYYYCYCFYSGRPSGRNSPHSNWKYHYYASINLAWSARLCSRVMKYFLSCHHFASSYFSSSLVHRCRWLHLRKYSYSRVVELLVCGSGSAHWRLPWASHCHCCCCCLVKFSCWLISWLLPGR